MQLIGKLDSPYVRRVAVSLQLLDLPFRHKPTAYGATSAHPSAIDQALEAPLLICGNGEVLLDSSLMLEHAEDLAGEHTLMPVCLAERLLVRRITGLALTACDK